MFAGDDLFRDLEDEVVSEEEGADIEFGHVREHLKKFLEGAYARYREIFSAKTGLCGLAALSAHGGYEAGQWVFHDGVTVATVQSWVNQHDGKYALLAPVVCNPGSQLVRSGSSLLLVPDRNVAPRWLAESSGEYEYHFSLLHPTHGEIDDYVIEHELRRLRHSRYTASRPQKT